MRMPWKEEKKEGEGGRGRGGGRGIGFRSFGGLMLNLREPLKRVKGN